MFLGHCDNMIIIQEISLFNQSELCKELDSIYGIILPGNEVMVRLCEKMGFTVERSREEVIATLNLTF